MKSRTLILDTNLLVLFVVGTASRAFIEKHKRLTEFTAADYDALCKIISAASSVRVTPNTLTETSNLAAYIGEPAKRRVFEVFRAVAANTEETYIPSRTASQREEFLRLGLTDASLIEASTGDATVLTTDLALYLAMLSQGVTAVNFNHIRDEYL